MNIGFNDKQITTPAQGRARLFAHDRMAALHDHLVDLPKQIRGQQVHIVYQCLIVVASFVPDVVNRHSTVTHYKRPNMTHPQEGGTGGEVSEILFFSAKSKRRPSLIYSMRSSPFAFPSLHDEKEFLQPDEVGQTGRRFPS